MSDIKQMISKSSHYLYGNVMVMFSHLISFPILTRILSVSDYGYLGLMTITIFLVVAFCKSGFQNSFVRFFEEHRHSQEGLETYYSTFFIGPVPICLLVR